MSERYFILQEGCAQICRTPVRMTFNKKSLIGIVDMTGNIRFDRRSDGTYGLLSLSGQERASLRPCANGDVIIASDSSTISYFEVAQSEAERVAKEIKRDYGRRDS